MTGSQLSEKGAPSMPGYCLLLALSLCLAGPAAAWAQGEPSGQDQSAQVEKLIKQLASPVYATREKARMELEKIGLPALDSLKKAAGSADGEVSQSAKKLMEKLEEAQQSAALLAPKLVHLKCQELPVTDVFKEMEKQSGYKINIQGTPNSRRITIDTGKPIPFWQAFDQVCEKAGLILFQPNSPNQYPAKYYYNQDIVVPAIPQPLPPIKKLKGGVVIPPKALPGGAQPAAPANLKANAAARGLLGAGGLPGPVKGAAQLQFQPVGSKISKYPTPTPGLNQPITVQVGTPAKIPTCYSGAMRIQLLKPLITPDEVHFTLKVTPEPGTDVSLTGCALIEKALDEQGKALAMVLNPSNVPFNPYYGSPSYYYNPNNQQKHTEVVVKLKREATMPKQLKELKGKVNTQMVLPTEPVIAVKNISKAQGKTEKGKDGGYIEVQNFQKNGNQYILQVRVETPPGMNNINIGNVGVGGGVFIQGNVVINGQFTNPQMGSLVLVDAKGQAVPFQYQSSNGLMVMNGKLIRQMTLYYSATGNAGDPDQLLLVGRRLTTVSIPFHFENVPLQ